MRTPTLTLGQLIEKLQQIDDPEKSVTFDFCNAAPTTFDSWRGVYAELALGWEVGRLCTVAGLLALARTANGSTFEGHKGGTYRMDSYSSVWVDNYGMYSSTKLAGVTEFRHKVVLNTEYAPYLD